ncbi:helix-turn-helix transcriptional regulator [Paenibacillus sp. GYB004]|uniref:helix-turn-helix domain-containing protein n=1 Tax=Paenibacillus sp. GYB004 TaxID=2994393 RepID=UPI002F967F02
MDKAQLKELGKRIKALREKQGMFQTHLADKIGKDRASVSTYENGTRVPPSDVLSRIAEVLHTSTDYLLGKTDDPLSFDYRFQNDFDKAVDDLTENGEFRKDLVKEVSFVLEEKFSPAIDKDFKFSPGEVKKIARDNYSFFFKTELLGALFSIAEKYGIAQSKKDRSASIAAENKTPPPDIHPMKEFVDNIDLSDDELAKQFKITVDGRPLSEQEMKKIIAFVRMERSFGDQT